MKAIIMAAGQSTRTYPLTITRPKPLLPIMNKPILAHQLDALQGLVDEVVVVTGYKREQVMAAFGNEYNGLRISYVYQEETLGTGHAVLQCADHIDAPCLVMNGDDLYAPVDLKQLLKTEQGALVKRVSDPKLFGIFDMAEDNRALRLVEKPKEVFSDLANIGAYKLPANICEILSKVKPSERKEIELTCAVQIILEQSAFHLVEVEGYWLPIGYPWNLLNANEYFLDVFLEHDLQGEISPNAHINGRVAIGEGTVIRSGVVIDGPAIIGQNCVVGPNCWLRGGTTLGNDVRIGHSVEIKNSIIMDHSAVPHLSYVGDSIIGEYVNFGAGTITANVRHDGANVHSMANNRKVDTGRRKFGAVVGDHVHTGINTCIFEGRKLWPHTMTWPGETVKKDIVDIKRTPGH